QGGLFSANRGRCGHGTPDAVPGDRDVTCASVSGPIGPLCPTVQTTPENEWDKLHPNFT
ncbi:hypothetical protein M9458_051207, partial [Cirrhinus mrigala]